MQAWLASRRKALQCYVPFNDDVLPSSTSEEWALRVPEDEKWKQLGMDACEWLLTKATMGISSRNILLVCLHALPVDMALAALNLNKAGPAAAPWVGNVGLSKHAASLSHCGSVAV